MTPIQRKRFEDLDFASFLKPQVQKKKIIRMFMSSLNREEIIVPHDEDHKDGV